MSRENVELAREVIEAVAARDISSLLLMTDPEIECRSFFAIAEGGEYHGHDGMRRYVRDLDEAWETLRPEITDLLDGGDVVVGVGRIHYRGKGGGVETESEAGWMFRFHHGKLIRFRAFRHPSQALEAIGLAE